MFCLFLFFLSLLFLHSLHVCLSVLLSVCSSFSLYLSILLSVCLSYTVIFLFFIQLAPIKIPPPLSSLKKQVDRWSGEEKIGHHFKMLAQQTRIYAQYLGNYPKERVSA